MNPQRAGAATPIPNARAPEGGPFAGARLPAPPHLAVCNDRDEPLEAAVGAARQAWAPHVRPPLQRGLHERRQQLVHPAGAVRQHAAALGIHLRVVLCCVSCGVVCEVRIVPRHAGRAARPAQPTPPGRGSALPRLPSREGRGPSRAAHLAGVGVFDDHRGQRRPEERPPHRAAQQRHAAVREALVAAAGGRQPELAVGQDQQRFGPDGLGKLVADGGDDLGGRGGAGAGMCGCRHGWRW
jgi:hypothetical protein